MKITLFRLTLALYAIFACQTTYAEDVVLNIQAIQGSDTVAIDSIELINKSNTSTLKVASQDAINSTNQINLTLGLIQLSTELTTNQRNIDWYSVKNTDFGVDLIAKVTSNSPIKILVSSPEGRTVYQANKQLNAGVSTFPVVLSNSAIFILTIIDQRGIHSFKLIKGKSAFLFLKENGKNQTAKRFASNDYYYSEGDSLQIRVKRENLWSTFWHGRPTNNDTAKFIIPNANNKFSQTEITNQNITINPSGFAPLTARIQITTSIPTKVLMTVFGKNGAASDVLKANDTISTTHTIDVLGLYPNFANIVQLKLIDENGTNLGNSSISLLTTVLSKELPSIVINTSLPSKKQGMTFVSYRAYLYDLATKPFIFDEFGDIRWYLDYSTSNTLREIMYDAGMERLRNGNLYFGDSSTNTIYEINMFGEILNSWPITGYDFHHQVLEKPNGNFIVNVDKHGLSTIEDFVIEIDRNTKQIINEWDLRKSLQYSRKLLSKSASDWIHTNAVEYDPADSCIIVSGRTQGVVKLDAKNHVKWLMAPHRGWEIAGNGIDLNTKLLQPLDANNQPITDTLIVNGYSNHPDFEWNWCQHAVKKQPNGHYTMFDNGDQRNYTTYGPYSRAVEYEIDETNMTIKQIWQYGKERGIQVYSRIVSDVDFLNDVKHVILSPGAISFGRYYAKAIEVDYESKNVLFEATIYPPIGYNFPLILHRTERLNLYP